MLVNYIEFLDTFFNLGSVCIIAGTTVKAEIGEPLCVTTCALKVEFKGVATAWYARGGSSACLLHGGTAFEGNLLCPNIKRSLLSLTAYIARTLLAQVLFDLSFVY